tara:strand:+ start:4161 stop:5270 length:1110 start_codon:yes stop_codon:yes gene_type:complete
MEKSKFANLFPMMETTEFNELKKDIKKNGLIEPIVVHNGEILDGRNRFKACEELGLTPTTTEYSGDNPLQYVISTNLRRRHLTASQRVMVARKSKPFFQEQARKRQGTRSDLKDDNIPELIPESEEGDARDKLGEVFNVSGRYVDLADEIIEKKPELEEQIISGEKTITEANREIKQEERQIKLKQQKKEIELGNVSEPSSDYDVIAIDPPWEYGTKYDPNHYMGRVSNPYPEMSLEQIKNIKLPAKDDCVLWLWITNKYLPEVKDILAQWGFEYKSILTWNKVNMGVGKWLRNVTEHCILAIKGKPYFNNTKITTLLTEKRNEHSAKPEGFFRIVEETCAGKKLEYFSRKKREGWDVYGDEVNQNETE